MPTSISEFQNSCAKVDISENETKISLKVARSKSEISENEKYQNGG